MEINDDKILQEFTSGQKNVALVYNNKFGKCIRKTRSANTSTARIEREVNIQNDFNSEYYPKIYYSEINSNKILIYEEYVEGNDLFEILAGNNKYKNNQKLCLSLLLDLIEALDLIWNKSIVHRDIKPNNIKIRSNGKPVILDLGIAKLLDSTDNLTTRMWFTPGYAPVEQFTNRIDLIDKRTDFFSLGVVIYELFFGQRLFLSNEEVMTKNPDFNQSGFNNTEKFNLIFSKLLEKQIYRRYRKSTDIVNDIKIAMEEC